MSAASAPADAAVTKPAATAPSESTRCVLLAGLVLSLFALVCGVAGTFTPLMTGTLAGTGSANSCVPRNSSFSAKQARPAPSPPPPPLPRRLV